MKRLILTLLAALTMTVWAAAYGDVPEDHWAAEAVAELTEERIVTAARAAGTNSPGPTRARPGGSPTMTWPTMPFCGIWGRWTTDGYSNLPRLPPRI